MKLDIKNRMLSLHMKKYKNIQLLLTIVCLVCFIPLFGQTADTLKHHYKVGIRNNFEPLDYLDKYDKPIGITADLLQEISKSANVSFNLFPMSFTQTVKALDIDEVDLIPLMITPERMKKYTYSIPYCQITQALFQSIKNTKNISLNSLNGHTIGFIEGDALLDTFATRTDFKKHIVLSKLDGFMHLRNGQIDAFFCGEQNGIKLISENNFSDIKLVQGNLYPRAYAFAARKNNLQLIQLLNSQIAIFQASGKLKELTNKWLNAKITTPSWIKVHETFLIVALSAFALIIISLLFWNWLLRTTVEEKTKSIKESELKYRDLIDNSPDAIAIYVDGIVVLVNNECLRLMRAKSSSELLGKNVIEFVHPDFRAIVIERMKMAFSDNSVLPLAEEKFIRLDGTMVVVEVKAMSIIYEHKKAVQLIVRDITERKQTEETLEKNRQDFIDLFDFAPIGYHEIDAQGRIIRINQTESNMLGYTVDELLGQNIWILNSDEEFSKKSVNSKLNGTLIPPNSFELEFRRKNGTLVSVLVKDRILKSNEGEITGIRTTVEDITEIKIARENLENERLLLRTVIDNIPDPIYAKDLEGRKTLANIAEVKMLGAKSESEVLGKNDAAFYSKEFAEKFNANDKILIETGKPDFNREGYIVDGNGQKIWMLSSKLPLRDKNNQIIGLVGIGRNITTRKQMEESLRESEEHFRTLVEKMPDGVYKSTSKGRFVSVNKAMVEMLGYDSVEDLLSVDIKSQLYFKESDRNRTMTNDKYVDMEIYRLRKKDGSEIWVEDHGWYLLDENSKILFHEGIMRDVTERLKSEQEIKDSREELKNFAAHLQNVREEERLMLANEIHDELGQILIAIKIDMGILKQKTLKVLDADKSIEILPKFESLFGMINNTINATRKIMTDNRHEVLHLMGFIESAKLQLTNFQEKYKILCQFESEIEKLEINPQQSIALFRILQESLSNVAKHSKATEVEVSLSINDDILSLEIKDNGIGFTEKQETRKDAFGFISMKERAFLLEGELNIHSESGNGTSIIVEMPYKLIEV